MYSINSALGALFLLIIIGVIFFFANESSEELSKDELIYVGEWTGGDEQYIKIQECGTVDYKSPGKSFSFGSAIIENDTLKLESFILTGKTFTIDQEPKEIDRETVMVLNGKEFTKKEE
ncbi:MAG: hypothetical protein ACOCQG_01220 [Candidatus Nanoarchaeia archaeon]